MSGRKKRLSWKDAMAGLADLSVKDPNGRDEMSPKDDMPAYTYANDHHCVAGHVAENCGLTLPPRKHRLNHRRVATVASEMGWFVDASWIEYVQRMQDINDRALDKGYTRTWTEIWHEIQTFAEKRGDLR